MKSTIENLSSTRAKIDIEADAAELRPALDVVYKELADQMQIPGFRKGKIPQEILKQRAGMSHILERAVNESINTFYQQAIEENKIFPLSQPEVEVKTLPQPETMEGKLELSFELDIRPTIVLPDYSELEVEVDEIETSAEDLQDALLALQERFGTLQGVDRPAKNGDFVALDLVAKVDGKEVDSAKNISYHIGSASMLEGMDEALLGLSAGESSLLATKLIGGDHAGANAEVKLDVNSVKERELPAATDDFAQMASEFDTLEELKENLTQQVVERKSMEQKIQAHEKALDLLLEKTTIPIPENLIEHEVKLHFETHKEDEHHEEHKAEIREKAKKDFQVQLLLDTLAEKEEIQIEQQELIDYIVASAQQYGMDPNEFAASIDKNGQTSLIVGEVGRKKALNKVLKTAKVFDTKGISVEMSVEKAAEEAENLQKDISVNVPSANS